MATPEPEYVEVYRTESAIVAQKMLDEVLRPEGIRAQMHDRLEKMFPGQGKPGGVYIAAAVEQADAARELIHEAIEDGFVEEDEGELL